MKKLFFIVAVMFLFVGLANNAMAQLSATATANAKIATAIRIEKATGGDMDFGTIAQPLAAGTVLLDATLNSRSSSDLSLLGTTFSTGKFTITGAVDQIFNITLPTSITVSATGATDMIVNGFTDNTTDHQVKLTSPTYNLVVGATLNVNANQKVATYISADPFEVTIAYN